MTRDELAAQIRDAREAVQRAPTWLRAMVARSWAANEYVRGLVELRLVTPVRGTPEDK